MVFVALYGFLYGAVVPILYLQQKEGHPLVTVLAGMGEGNLLVTVVAGLAEGRWP